MGLTRTEQRNDKASGLDERSPEDILRLLYEAQLEAAASVARATDSIAKASLLLLKLSRLAAVSLMPRRAVPG